MTSSINEERSATPGWKDLPDELTLREAAAIVRVHQNTFKLWISQGRTPRAYLVGQSWRISKAALRSWMQAGKLGRRSA